MIDKEVIDILERMAQVLEGKINGKTGEILHEHSFFTGHLPECKACWAERLVAERDALAQKVKELENKYKEDEHIIERYVERVKWDQERVNQLIAERDALAQKVKELEKQNSTMRRQLIAYQDWLTEEDQIAFENRHQAPPPKDLTDAQKGVM